MGASNKGVRKSANQRYEDFAEKNEAWNRRVKSAVSELDKVASNAMTDRGRLGQVERHPPTTCDRSTLKSDTPKGDAGRSERPTPAQKRDARLALEEAKREAAALARSARYGRCPLP